VLQKAAEPFGVRYMRWDAVVVLAGAWGKGSSVKLLGRAAVYRQTPRKNRALLF